MTDSGKPRDSGTENTLLASDAVNIDATIPAQSGGDATRMSRPSIPLTPTQRYRLGNEIGRGGMGRVVEAFDTQLGRVVALKEVLPSGQGVVRRFVREIEITARLEHASIVPLYDSGTTVDGRPFYVMKLITGRPLDEEIRRAPTLDERLTLLPAMLSAIDAIAHAHRRGVIHRDLKPSNILVGELGQTTVIDWGLAKVIGETDEPASHELRTPTAADSLHTQMGAVFGTPGFMSPEQARGEELTPTVDVYALGATMYQLLAGRPPVGGTSATELIGKTLTHDVQPIAAVVDGVPKDLVAIIDKALSFEADVRYRDAGELAADLRRFQAGQLVAAHQYTRRQRLAKFAQRNRAVLGVVAIAIATLAVIATFGIRRIITERDAANDARKHALIEKHAAEEARDRVAERTDALLIIRGRTLLDTNPTQALLAVAGITSSSPRYGEARSVAQAAVTRGVWWGIAGPDEDTIRAELSPDGNYLLQITRSETLRVWDLDRRRIVLARPYGEHANAKWAGDRVFVWTKAAPPELLEPAANKSTPLPGEPVSLAYTTTAGDVALVMHADASAALIDLRTGVRTPVWPGHKIYDIGISTDGTWMLVSDATTVVALDRAGTVLAEHPAGKSFMILGARRGALVSYDSIDEFILDPQPTWRTVRLPESVKSLIPVAYRGAALDLVVNGQEIYTVNQQGIMATSGRKLDSVMIPMSTVGEQISMLPTQQGVVLHGDNARTMITVPAPLVTPRFVGRAGVTRIVALGKGLIMGVDLADVLPRNVAIDRMANNLVFDANTLIGWYGGSALTWIDLTTKRPTRVDVDGFLNIIAMDEASGRALAVDMASKPRRLYLVRRNESKGQPIVAGEAPWGLLISGGAVVYGTRDPGGALTARLADGTDRKLEAIGSEMISCAPLGHTEAVLVGSGGHVLRINVVTGASERAKIQPGETMIVATDRQSKIAIGVDNRILVWEQGTIKEVAILGKRITDLRVRGDNTAIAVTEDNTAFRVALVENATPKRLLTSAVLPAIDESSTRIATFGVANDTVVVDVETGARWTMPMMRSSQLGVRIWILDGGGIYSEEFGTGLVFRKMPTVVGDLATWAHERTTARLVDDELVWPWQ